jgi:carbamoyl-phosphate synthase small subunit
MRPPAIPTHASAVLVLADGSIFWGKGVGTQGTVCGEACFNTSMTGYQEIMTDPSYAGQLIAFTFPHIGNTGTNLDDNEAVTAFAKGIILRADITSASNYRSDTSFNDWLKTGGITGICGIDTRALTRRLRDGGAQNAVIYYPPTHGPLQEPALLERLLEQARTLPDMSGLDMARTVSTKEVYHWDQTSWNPETGYGKRTQNHAHVVVVDYGVKRNILRCLSSQGFKLTVVPCDMSAEAILALNPDGIFLSNGPGDPSATGAYAVPILQKLLQSNLPLFGICLGHQILAIALGGKTAKLPFGHRGANHPVKDIRTGKVEITSQNHGFHVLPDTLPTSVEVTHTSLFDGTNEGICIKDRPVFSVQYHPESSPGPQDSHHLFARFKTFIEERQRKNA